MGAAVGAATGVITALTGVFVLPTVPWLQSLGLARDEMNQALGLSFTTSTLALAVMLADQDHLGTASALQSALVLAPALIGMAVGQKARQVMSEAAFRRAFFAGLLLLGGWLVLR